MFLPKVKVSKWDLIKSYAILQYGSYCYNFLQDVMIIVGGYSNLLKYNYFFLFNSLICLFLQLSLNTRSSPQCNLSRKTHAVRDPLYFEWGLRLRSFCERSEIAKM